MKKKGEKARARCPAGSVVRWGRHKLLGLGVLLSSNRRLGTRTTKQTGEPPHGRPLRMRCGGVLFLLSSSRPRREGYGETAAARRGCAGLEENGGLVGRTGTARSYPPTAVKSIAPIHSRKTKATSHDSLDPTGNEPHLALTCEAATDVQKDQRLTKCQQVKSGNG